jgi:hypothetical protein
MLEPSNMVGAVGTDEPIEYERWTLEELQAEGQLAGFSLPVI